MFPCLYTCVTGPSVWVTTSLSGRLTDILKEFCKHWIVVIILSNSPRITPNSDLERDFFLTRALSLEIVSSHLFTVSIVSFTISPMFFLSSLLREPITSALYLSKDKARDLKTVRSEVMWCRSDILACSRAFNSSAVLLQYFFTSMATLTRPAVVAVSPRQLQQRQGDE